MKKYLINLLSISFLLFASSCSVGQKVEIEAAPSPTNTITPTLTPTSDPLKNRAGEWSGKTKTGEFNFTVSPDGKRVTDLYISMTSGGITNTLSGLLDDIEIGEDNEFGLGYQIQFHCEFGKQGKSAKGYIGYESYLEEWEIEH